MTATRRILVLAGTILTVMIGTSLPASATYADTAARTTSITTATVQAPTALTVNDSCVTTTVTTKRTVYRNPSTGAQTQTAYSQTTSTATSSSNVDTTTTSTAAGPGPYETTTTTVDKNTNVHVTVSWGASTSPRVTGYVVNAHLGIDGSVLPMLTTTATSASAVEDADVLTVQARVSVVTQTAYRWTASTPLSALVGC